MTLAEIVATQKPAILVPSPNVADDHQTKNALSLVEKNAACFLADKDCVNQLKQMLPEFIQNKEDISQNLKQIQIPSFADVIMQNL
jgi:UDP-N-acetylglucosamine--N-acetylmuramyl-(pentapeptide) pyrophosphoryl-undecaprenol N-acetylglucosamine transferase